MRIVLWLVIILVGAIAGGGAWYVTNPSEPGHAAAPEGPENAIVLPEPAPDDDAASREFIRLNNQFVVPVLRDGAVSALVIMSLTIEAPTGSREAIFASEPKLRDALLSTLFDHANSGGFDGVFTETRTLASLRASLRETARSVLSDEVHDVLIMDLVRQDASAPR